MKYKVIGTGSSGNALLLENGVLIDCGVPYKEIKDEVIGLVLLTHKHQDHLKVQTVKSLAKDHPMLRFACPAYLAQDLVEKCMVDTRRVDIIQEGAHYDYGLATIRSFPLVHDVPNVGWICEINGESLMYMTDTGQADHLSGEIYEGLDYYFIEANYRDDEELDQKIEEKIEAGEFAYESRVRNTHLSLEQAKQFIEFFARPDSKVIWLHEHKDKKKKKEKTQPAPELRGLLQPVDADGNIIAGGNQNDGQDNERDT